MIKQYLLDTNVLLHDPSALFNFQENDVYLLNEILVELDKFKRGSDEVNANAREVIRVLERLTQEGALENGVALDSGGKLFILPPSSEPEAENNLERMVQHGLRLIENKLGYADDRILEHLRGLSEQEPERDTCLVTKDLNLRIRARAMRLRAADYLHDKAALDLHAFFERDPYLQVSKDIIDNLFQSKAILAIPVPAELKSQIQPNEYYILRYDSQSALVKCRGDSLMRVRETAVEGIRPRNHSQSFLLDACLDTDYTIVSALGKAGTGKTLLAIAAGLQQVLGGDTPKYKKMIVIRPILEVGKELGYLPGEIDEKIDPYFKPIKDSLKFILKDITYPGLWEKIELMPINFVRGDTFHDSYILVDEAQNFTAKELKVIGTRVGENSKLVLVGDPFQIDNPYLDEKSNGLTVLTDRFRGKLPEFAYVILDKVERGRVADVFANYL